MWSALEAHVAATDRAILVWLSHLRTPHLTAMMVDFTALGSPALIAVFTTITLALMITMRDGLRTLHMLAGGFGTWGLIAATKGIIERTRPTVVEHLVQVSGYSFPSGHSLSAGSLYLTMAIVAGDHLGSRGSKAVLIAGASFLIAMVALSRVYLGVHYPSDVLSGMSLGVTWALILAYVVEALRMKKILASARA